MMYSGIDLHSNNSVIAIIDDADHVVAQKRLPNEITKIIEFLARWRDDLAGIVVESTYNWYWLVDGLQDAGLHVHLANTAAIKQYDGLKHSGDETDAQHLAHLLRLGILLTGTILPREHRVVRDLALKRMQMVNCCTTHVLAVENIVATKALAHKLAHACYHILKEYAATNRRNGRGSNTIAGRTNETLGSSRC